jgi:hypothetical protein
MNIDKALLRDDQWHRIAGFLPGKLATADKPPQIIDSLYKLSSSYFGLACLGEICLPVSDTGTVSIDGFLAGQTKGP